MDFLGSLKKLLGEAQKVVQPRSQRWQIPQQVPQQAAPLGQLEIPRVVPTPAQMINPYQLLNGSLYNSGGDLLEKFGSGQFSSFKRR